MDLSASLTLLKKLVEDASPGRRIVRTESEPDGVYYVVDAAGEMVRKVADESPNECQAADLKNLVAWTTDLAPKVARIWYARNGVKSLVAGDAYGPHTCCVNLTPSPQLARLMQWDAKGEQILDQKQFVLILRTMFAGCCNPAIIDAVRNIRTQRSADIASQVQQGKASVGKSMIAEMTGTGGIAVMESFALNVPVFAQAAVSVTAAIRVEVEPDPINERFTLVVRPGDVEAAFAYAEETIGSRIAALLKDAGDSTTRAYRGIFG